MKNRNISIALLLALLVNLVQLPARAAAAPLFDELDRTYLSQPGSSGLDNHISDLFPTTNGGTQTILAVGKDAAASATRGLVKFDLTSIAPGSTVTGATLSLWVNQDLSNNARTMRVFRVKQNWVETQSTWNIYSTGNNWQTPGASGANDRESTEIGSVALTDSQSVGDRIDIDLDPALIQEMITGGSFTNNGFLLQMDTEVDDRYNFRSSDHATSGERPQLVIEYTVPPPGPTEWICRDTATHYICPDPNLPVNPYLVTGDGAHSSGGDITTATLDCTPTPDCYDDYSVYFRVEGTFTWSKGGSPLGDVTVEAEVSARGGPDHTQEYACGSGNSGFCEFAFSGIVPYSEMPTTGNSSQVTMRADLNANPVDVTVLGTTEFTYEVYFSLGPFDEGCDESYYLLTTDGPYPIDPLIEFPVGDPTDEQIVTMIPDQLYMVSTEGGPWNDGTDDNWDSAVSWDGTTWISLAELSASALCIIQDPTHPDLMTLFIIAESDTFHIRANDSAGDFADNSEIEVFLYTVGLAIALGPPPCEAQFSYDSETDLIGVIEVPATSASVLAELDEGEAFEDGEWYALEIYSGDWSDNGGPARIDLEYSWPFDIEEISGDSLNYEDLGSDTSNVWCTGSDDDLFFLQASGPDLYLRVNDQDFNFANNTGTVYVAIYHATFMRAADLCETPFQKGAYVASGSVGATQENGVIFGTALNDVRGKEIVYAVGLEPGGWYVLETTLGPWRWQGSTRTQAAVTFEMSIKVDDDWVPLTEWEEAECITPLDALGHVRVYFQAPVNEGGRVFELRVNDTSSWGDNIGTMGWDIYHGVDLSVANPDDSCDYSHDEDPIATGRILGNQQDGAVINGLSAGGFYAIELLGDEHAWQESTGGADQYAMQISHKTALFGGSLDPEQEWFDLPNDFPGVLCSVADGQNLLFYLKVDQPNSEIPPVQYRLRADSETFLNNTGYMDYRVYASTPGDSIDNWVSCISSDEYNVIVVTQQGLIPVIDEEGISIYSRQIAVQELGSSISGSPLTVGNTYVVQTLNGPWTDDETNEHRYGAELSSDGGVTWAPIERGMSGVICAEPDKAGRYWKVLFTVDSGQAWRIRVANEENDFTDNGGSLAFRLYLAAGQPGIGNAFPEGKAKIGTCDISPLRPEWGATGDVVLTGHSDGGALPDEEDTLGSILVNIITRINFWILQTSSYISEWIDYLGAEVFQYFAWCDRHTDSLLGLVDMFWDVEPLATIAEWQALATEIKVQLDGYSWNNASAPESVLGQGSINLGSSNRPGDPVGGGGGIGSTIREGDAGEFDKETQKYILPVLPSSSPWNGGPLITYQSAHPTSYYISCTSSLTNIAGPLLMQGVCAASAIMRETGASFYLQLVFDFAAVAAIIRITRSGVKSIVAMTSGVPNMPDE
jgi:hypothetical protein